MDILEPSKEIWNYYKGKITLDLILSSIADVIANYYISYSAKELLKDLKLITPKNKINIRGKKILAHHLHDKYHHNSESVCVVNPLHQHEKVREK